MSCVPVCFYVPNGVLMRNWRPVDVPANEEWTNELSERPLAGTCES
jgi:hypothetical protein